MEHRQIEHRPAAPGRSSGDDPVRFLRELRQLRDGAGLGQAELAARAHYPYDRIKAAEVGPTLPDLPVLSAYVRGCGGTTEEWEERWRSLTSAPTLPLLDARPAGESTAASAGARIGAISPAADTPDPAVILAALDRVGEEMAVGAPATLPSRAAVTTIEQRPAAAAPSTAKSTTAKAASTKVAAWETTTMRTAWSSTSGSAAPEARQANAVGSATPGAATTPGAPTTPGAATTPGAEAISGTAATAGTRGSRTIPEQAGTGYSAVTKPGAAGSAGAAKPTGATGAAGAIGAAGTSTVAPWAATAAAGAGAATGASPTGASPTSAAATSVATRARSHASRGLSRTTVAALIAIGICVLVALLAVVV